MRVCKEREFVMVSCLLIDKNASERSRIMGYLNGFGFECVERDGADEAIRFCQESQPEVVLMEASALPATKEFLRLMKYQNKHKQPPIVILYSDKPDLSAMGNSIVQGAADFLVTPFDRDLLHFKLEQAGALPH
jgi:two-component system, chemotaxis family, chemotaxis protein CheY